MFSVEWIFMFMRLETKETNGLCLLWLVSLFSLFFSSCIDSKFCCKFVEIKLKLRLSFVALHIFSLSIAPFQVAATVSHLLGVKNLFSRHFFYSCLIVHY
jgi:hypothetical protein